MSFLRAIRDRASSELSRSLLGVVQTPTGTEPLLGIYISRTLCMAMRQNHRETEVLLGYPCIIMDRRSSGLSLNHEGDRLFWIILDPTGTEPSLGCPETIGDRASSWLSKNQLAPSIMSWQIRLENLVDGCEAKHSTATHVYFD